MVNVTRMVKFGVALAAILLLALPAASSAGTPGPRVRRQIVGGQPATGPGFRSLAYVTDLVSQTEVDACTGTVLSPNVVLTAAHCVLNLDTGVPRSVSGYTIYTGSVDTQWPSEQVSGVSRVIVDPGFQLDTFEGGDAALLVLSPGTTAPPIKLADGSQTSLWQAGTQLAIAGWGDTVGDVPGTEPQTLRWATTFSDSSADCSARASGVGLTFNANDELCTIDAPTFADAECHGDSGGPLLAGYGTTSPIEVGITSYSTDPDCSTDAPDYFTRADLVAGWAESWVAALASPAGQRPASGAYLGDTSQHRTIAVHVAASRVTISSVRFRYRLRCTRHKPFSSKLAQQPARVAIRNLRFSRSFTGRGGDRYTLAGRFNIAGRVKGTLSVRLHKRSYGTCRSGLVHWSAGAASS